LAGIINYGEFIKYVHDAIEWENILFFAYPCFWDTVRNWQFKRFLRHPDPIHREFLRSRAMRVVLTIRPGFEESFAMLQQTGDSTAPPNRNYPYVTIAEDMRNFAMTNYEGIPPANPDNYVRPLLYPAQRKAWNDMQKLIQLIEHYNDSSMPVSDFVRRVKGRSSHQVQEFPDLRKRYRGRRFWAVAVNFIIIAFILSSCPRDQQLEEIATRAGARAAPVRGSAGRNSRRACKEARRRSHGLGASPAGNPRRARGKVTFVALNAMERAATRLQFAPLLTRSQKLTPAALAANRAMTGRNAR
jgi:hypothetical protein